MPLNKSEHLIQDLPADVVEEPIYVVRKQCSELIGPIIGLGYERCDTDLPLEPSAPCNRHIRLRRYF